MLEKDYRQVLAELIAEVTWDIDLPEGREAFFRESGLTSSVDLENRTAVRMRARAHGILYYDESLPAFPRSDVPLGIFTTDFSKSGIGFISSHQFLPEEVVRIILPTFWTRVKVTRCNLRSANCFHSGGILISWRDPSMEAYV